MKHTHSKLIEEKIEIFRRPFSARLRYLILTSKFGEMPEWIYYRESEQYSS